MNLKKLGNNSAAIPVVVKQRLPLIASAATAVAAASPTIASAAVASATGVAGIIGARGMIGSTMSGIAPAKEMAPAVAASGIRASVRSSAAV